MMERNGLPKQSIYHCCFSLMNVVETMRSENTQVDILLPMAAWCCFYSALHCCNEYFSIWRGVHCSLDGALPMLFFLVTPCANLFLSALPITQINNLRSIQDGFVFICYFFSIFTQTSMNTLREDAKSYLTPKSMFEYLSKKSSFGSLADSINLKDLKNQIDEKIFNGKEADKETQYKIFLCMNSLFLIEISLNSYS